jgi:transcriptional regulator with XRE-family HTH domain
MDDRQKHAHKLQGSLKPHAPTSLIGERVHLHRIQRSLSQIELAKLAGISRTTVQKVESGQEVRMSVLAKLAAAMRTIEWEFLAPAGEWNRPYRIYDNEDPEWLVTFNRAKSTGLYLDGTAVPDLAEKERLGRLGFVSAFNNRLNCGLPTGRLGAAVVEIYGKDEKGPYRHPEEEFVYVLRGEVRIRIGEETIDLKEGQAMTFWPTEPHLYELPRPLRKDQEPPLLLMVWMAAPKPKSSSASGKRRRKSRSVNPKPSS